jgi:uncharacterized protein YraI
MKIHVNIRSGPITIIALHIPNAGVLCNRYDRHWFRILYEGITVINCQGCGLYLKWLNISYCEAYFVKYINYLLYSVFWRSGI